MSEALRGGQIVRFALQRPVSVGMLLIALVVLGLISYLRIPIELVPSGFTPPFLFVEVPTLPSAPTDVEREIAIPVEERLASVRNVRSLVTRVGSTSASFFMEFRDGTHMDLAYNQVRDRMDQLMPTLDDGVGRYVVWKYNPSDEPVLWFGVRYEGQGNAAWRIENLVVPRVERLPGVSRVEVYGAPSPALTVRVPDRGAESVGMSLSGLVQHLGRDNFSLSGGVIEEGGQRLPVRVDARHRSTADLASLPLGGGLRLGDIAQVEVRDRAEQSVYRVDAAPSVFLAVYKESSSNTVDVTRAVRQIVELELPRDRRLEDFEYAFFFDQGLLIQGAISNLESTAIWGGILAIVLLALFLRRVGLTLLIALAIPVSLLATVVFMYFVGRTLNVLSLTGLMLSVGMVVDNAIVVVEAIQARMLQGDPPLRAAYRGTAEVALAIVVATSTTVVVFLPLILMTGAETISFYLSQIGLPVCVALIASLAVSLIFVPLGAAFGLRAQAPREVRVVTWLQERYSGSLGFVIRYRADAVIVSALVFSSLIFVARAVPRTDQSEPNINDFRVFLTIPDEVGWDERESILLAYEAALWAKREEFGIEHLLVRMGGPWGRPQLRAFLKEPDRSTPDRQTVIEETLKILPEFPGVENSLDWSSSGGASNALALSIGGPDSTVLAGLAEEAARRLREIDGVTSVRTESGDTGAREVHFVVDRDRALRVGLNALGVGATLDFALRGRQLESLRMGGEELPVFVEGSAVAADELSEIRRLAMPAIVPGVLLEDVASIERTRGYGSIDREDRQTMVSITVMSRRDDLENLRREIETALDDMQMPRGYARKLGGRFAGLDTDRQQQNFAVLLAVVFVFLLMGVLFESVVLPLSILLSIPFAFVGVYWALFLTGTSFDMMAGVGAIILIGVVVNNGIVLVDRIEEFRREGQDRHDAVVNAARQRLRPILMTALTTIVGLIPMALGTSALVGIPYSPLGRAVIGGLVASTLLTLFVVPLFYTLFDDARAWVARVFATIAAQTLPPR